MTPQKRPTRPSHTPHSPFPATLAAARAGNQAALAKLFEQFYPRVERQVHLSLATDLRRNRPWLTTRFSTGDVVHEVFQSVLKDLHGFDGGTEELFAHYLTTVVRNRLIDIVRYHEAERRDGRKTKAPPEDDLFSSESDGPPGDAISAEQRQIYGEILGSFPEREQQLLRRRIEDGAEFQDLTEELGYPSLSTTRRTFYAAQAQLVIRLKQRNSDQTK